MSPELYKKCPFYLHEDEGCLDNQDQCLKEKCDRYDLSTLERRAADE